MDDRIGSGTNGARTRARRERVCVTNVSAGLRSMKFDLRTTIQVTLAAARRVAPPAAGARATRHTQHALLNHPPQVSINLIRKKPRARLDGRRSSKCRGARLPPTPPHHSPLDGARFPDTPPSLRPRQARGASVDLSSRATRHLSLRAQWRPGGLSTTPLPPSSSWPPPLRRNSRPPSCDHRHHTPAPGAAEGRDRSSGAWWWVESAALPVFVLAATLLRTRPSCALGMTDETRQTSTPHYLWYMQGQHPGSSPGR